MPSHHRPFILACAMLAACASPVDAPLALAPLSLQAADDYYVLGRNQYAARRPADALASYRQALRLAPGHVNARNGLAVLHAANGDYANAIALLRALTQEGPPAGSAFLFVNLGHAYFLSGDDERAIAALEQACLLDPSHAGAWRQLGVVLEHAGQFERAARMRQQARSLQQHDHGADQALLATAPPEAFDPWPADMARTEIVQQGGMYALQRTAAPAASAIPPAAPSAAPSAEPVASAPRGILRVEIRNGNGVPGMAAALARTLARQRLQVVRLANEKTFDVARSRVDYGLGQQGAARALAGRLGAVVPDGQACETADLCIILGRDLTDIAALQRHYQKQLALARAALARLG